MIRIALALLLALAIAGPLASCGKKGDPELPKGKTDQFPSTYPSS
jgi:predicted small lipoprotein YifL